MVARVNREVVSIKGFAVTLLDKVEKALVFTARNIISPLNPPMCTKLMVSYYRRHGMRIIGQPNYLSAKIWFDGGDYSLIELNEGCTISSNVRILTHDGAPYTVGRSIGMKFSTPLVVFRPIRIGPYAFIGTNSVVLPGTDVGRGAIIGGGSVVRGKVPDWTIMVGNPARPKGDSREYLRKQLERSGLSDLIDQFNALSCVHKEK